MMPRLRPPPGSSISFCRSQEQRRPRFLRKVEILTQVSQLPGLLTYIGTAVGPPVGERVQPLTVQEEVLDKLHVNVVAVDLMVDVAMLGKRADDDSRNAQAIAGIIDNRRDDVVIKPSPVIPGKKNHSAVPVGSLHDGVD